MKKKKLSLLLTTLLFTNLLSSDAVFAAETVVEHSVIADSLKNNNLRVGMNRGMGQGSGRVETDQFVLDVMAQNASKFEQRTYTDPVTDLQLPFSIYLPADIVEGEKLPLVLYIPDASAAGKDAKTIVENYFGASVFVTEEAQTKHKSIVVVPAFPEVVVDDDFQTSAYIETAVSLLKTLVEKYKVDEDRIYTTGQSMGCMTSLYLNSKYPDLFAASLFVAGQWDKAVLGPLKFAKFFYITAAGDQKASNGQAEVRQLLKDNQVPYSYFQWSAKDSEELQFLNVKSMLNNKKNANFIRFTEGSVLYDGQNMEHMASFNFAYKLTPVIDWLYEQKK